MNKNITIKSILAALLFTLPTLAFSVDLDSYYITPKVGVSKSMNTGTTTFTSASDNLRVQSGKDLGTGTAFGLSLGKYITKNFRLELEAIKRAEYDYDTYRSDEPLRTSKADIETHALFINGFYDFHPFFISSTPIALYLGSGIGVSRNKMGTVLRANDGGLPSRRIGGKTTSQFTYKLSAGALFNLTENIYLDVNYQYVDLSAFKSKSRVTRVSDGTLDDDLIKGYTGGEIKSQEIMFGLQYKFN
ncbi:MAG: opacity protein-like surface antigen [Methylophilaceae bacterium]